MLAETGGSPTAPGLRSLCCQSIRSRMVALDLTYRAGVGHVGPDFSCMDILTALYFRVLRVNPKDPNWVARDRFILSKGHAAGALYATLSARGFFPTSWLQTYQEFDSKLPGHPDRNKVPGVEHCTGALGHGLPVGVGMAAGLRDQAKASGQVSPRVFVLLGDGELQEGSNWEAAMSAAHMGLENLVAIVDRNRVQQGDFTEKTVSLEDLAAKWASFGWTVRHCSGHDMAELIATLGAPAEPVGKPVVVIANTIKGRGVSFMEGTAKWHHKIPSTDERNSAMTELVMALAKAEGE